MEIGVDTLNSVGTPLFQISVPQSTLLTEKSVVHEIQKPHLKLMVGSIVKKFDENDIGSITATFDEAGILPKRLVSD